MRRRQATFLLAAAALACSLTLPAPVAAVASGEGDSEAEALQVDVVVRVVGPDSDGGESTWVDGSVELGMGQNAWQATTKALAKTGVDYQSAIDTSGETLASLESPYDGRTWGPNASNGDSWVLFVNGSLEADGAGSYQPKDGDELLWYYHRSHTYVTVSAVGPGGTGEVFWLDPVTLDLQPGQSAWDACLEAFGEGGFEEGRTLYYGVDGSGNVTLGSLSSLGPNGITGESWQLFVNGAPAEENVSTLALQDGDDLCWYYANVGDETLPEFARSRIAQAKRDGADRIDGRVYVAWGRRLAGYLPRAGADDADDEGPTLEVVGDRLEISLGGTAVELSCATGSVVSVSAATDRADLQDAGGQTGGWLRDQVSLLGAAPAPACWAWGPDGSFYYIESTGVAYRLVIL